MECFQHPETAASALCGSCNKALCHFCASRFTVVQCQNCLSQHNRGVAIQHIGRLLVTAVLFCGGTIAFAHKPFPYVMGAAFASMFWGWIVFREHPSGSATLVMSPGLWLVLGVVKLLLCACVGLIAAPVGIIRSIIQVHRAWQVRAALRDEPVVEYLAPQEAVQQGSIGRTS